MSTAADTKQAARRHGAVHRCDERSPWQLTEPLMALYEWALAHENELARSPQETHPPRLPASRPTLTLAPSPAA
jgi:hypothetical protein